MVEIYEVLAGTSFFIPLVVLIWILGGTVDSFISAIAVLVLPVGWLVVSFQRFIFTFRGRYERYPALEHIRQSIIVRIEGKEKKYIVDLSNVLQGDEYQIKQLALTEEEYERIFDPYKRMPERFLFFGKSYRSKQPELFREKYGKNVPKPFFVENIENLFFFQNEGLSRFIGAAISTYHASQAALCGLLLGTLFSIGLGLLLVYQKILPFSILGIILIFLALYYMIWATKIQSTMRRNESQASEELLVRLRTTTLCPETRHSTT